MRRGLVILLSIVGLVSCEEKKFLLTEVSSEESGVTFSNTLTEDSKFNILEYLYFYNGAGVSVGDINNDSLPDIYFVSNQGENKLYLNQGDFHFKDITGSAGVPGVGNWETGTTMADVNGDGHLDIFVCGVGNYKGFNSRNQLYINNGDLTFSDRTKELGLDFVGFSTHATFFDYDKDGDLDMYLLNHSVHSVHSYGRASLRLERDSAAGDRLYRNEFSQTGRTYFTEVTTQAGIYSSHIGYGLGVGVGDVNGDNFPDIYVSNDFHENDYLYINNGDGTFRESIKESMAHTSRFSMGNDVADINNDLRPDVFTTDMLPRDESVIKTSSSEDPYEIFQFKLKYGYHPQYSRNCLQMNRGNVSGTPVFSDYAPLSGLEATDWSWSPLLTDVDGDGRKDVIITNGILRRPNNLDYLNFISADSAQQALRTSTQGFEQLIRQMPEGRVSNFFFKNEGEMRFSNQSGVWIEENGNYSNGMAIADFDRDGDPDYVINQLNAVASLIRNNSIEEHGGQFIKVNLSYSGANPRGIGSKVILYGSAGAQLQELYNSRGWCSSSDFPLIFGIGNSTIDSVSVIWPDGKSSLIVNPSAGELNIRYASASRDVTKNQQEDSRWFTRSEFDFIHRENEFNAFNRESLMPLMSTAEGPPVLVGDVDGDGLDDVFTGGGRGQPAVIMKQLPSGAYIQIPQPALVKDSLAEDVAAAWIDANSDGKPDLLVGGGGQELLNSAEEGLLRLYLNNGKGVFARAINFPSLQLNVSCIVVKDYDLDGDEDFFVGADVTPLLYGIAPPSYMVVNLGDGKFYPNPQWAGRSTFDNATITRPGMVKDAAWANLNDDELPDLVLAGEWMPITILIQNRDHSFSNATDQFGFSKSHGLWNTVEVNDLNGDGRDDIIAGNLGLNSRLKASEDLPLKMYVGDFDNNGSSDHILIYNNEGKLYPFASRDQLIKQLPHLKKKFLKYESYKNARPEDVIEMKDKKRVSELQVEILESCVFLNQKQGFIRTALPWEIQATSIQDIKVLDLNGDARPEILFVGNTSTVQPDIGAYDAGLGGILINNGNGALQYVDWQESGFYVPGEARNIAFGKDKANKQFVLVSRNNKSLLRYDYNK